MTYSSDENEDRRQFLKACGKFAVVTPPAITALLSTSLSSTAIAHSGGGVASGDPGGHGIFDNGPDDPHDRSGGKADSGGSSQGGGGQGGGGGDGGRTPGRSAAYDSGGGAPAGGSHGGPDGNDDGSKRRNVKLSRDH